MAIGCLVMIKESNMKKYVFGLFVLVALAVSGKELIKNGNFEQLLEGWIVPS